MSDVNITKDPLYEAIAVNDLDAMLAPSRYEARSSEFDRIIASSHEHYWDPMNPKYIDFSQPFDLETQPLVDEATIWPLHTAYVSDRLQVPRERTRFINEMTLHLLSSILHAEQAGVSVSASLCHVFADQGAQEYAANQTREEARHVTAFTRYIKVRWGQPVRCNPTLQALFREILTTSHVYKKIVGMQILIEGLAMGSFATLYKAFNDPLGRRLVQLVMTDEAFHHKFGRTWAERTIPKLSEKEHAVIEYWAAHCFQSLLINLISPEEQRTLYERLGLDPRIVVQELGKLTTKAYYRERMSEASNVFRVVIKTLLSSGIITDRTRAFYAAYVDFDDLYAEGGSMVGDDIAEEGLRYLRSINFKTQMALHQ